MYRIIKFFQSHFRSKHSDVNFRLRKTTPCTYKTYSQFNQTLNTNKMGVDALKRSFSFFFLIFKYAIPKKVPWRSPWSLNGWRIQLIFFFVKGWNSPKPTLMIALETIRWLYGNCWAESDHLQKTKELAVSFSGLITYVSHVREFFRMSFEYESRECFDSKEWTSDTYRSFSLFCFISDGWFATPRDIYISSSWFLLKRENSEFRL